MVIRRLPAHDVHTMATSHWGCLPRDVESRILEGAGRLEHEEILCDVLAKLPAAIVARALRRVETTIVEVIEESGCWLGSNSGWSTCGEDKRPDFPRLRAAVQELLVFQDRMTKDHRIRRVFGNLVDLVSRISTVEDARGALLKDDDVFWDEIYTAPQPAP